MILSGGISLELTFVMNDSTFSSLALDKEQFNLADLIFSIVEDFRSDIQKKGSNIRLLYEPYNQLLVR
jgi:hypothetical protein